MSFKITKDRINLEGIIAHAKDFYSAYRQAQQNIRNDTVNAFDYRLVRVMPAIYRLITSHSDMFSSEQKHFVRYIHDILFASEVSGYVGKGRECYICPNGHLHTFTVYEPMYDWTDEGLITLPRICCMCHQNLEYVGFIDDENDDGYCQFRLESISAKEIYNKDDISIIDYRYRAIRDNIPRNFDTGKEIKN